MCTRRPERARYGLVVEPEQRLGRLVGQLPEQRHLDPVGHADRVGEVDGGLGHDQVVPGLHLLRQEGRVVVLADPLGRDAAVVVEVEVLGEFGFLHVLQALAAVRVGRHGDVGVVEGVHHDHDPLL